MLPHFPALLLLLVSSGGSDLSHPPPPPWKPPAPSRPSSPPPPAGPPESAHGADTLTSSTPEIKVRNQVFSDAADHLQRPSGGHRHASPPGSPGGNKGVAGKATLVLQEDSMVHQPPARELRSSSWAGSGPSGDVNTWVITAASRAAPHHANHRLSPFRPSISPARGCRPRDAPEHASHFITDTPWRGSQPHALVEASHQAAPPALPLPSAHHVNSSHSYFTTSVARDPTTSGQPLTNQITAMAPSGGDVTERGRSTTASTQQMRIGLHGDGPDATTHISKSGGGGGTTHSWPDEKYLGRDNKSAARVRSSDAAQTRHKISEVEASGGAREVREKEGTGEEGINVSPSSSAFSASLSPQGTNARLPSVLRQQPRHLPIILMSDNPGGATLAKKASSSNVFGGGGNSREEAAATPLRKAWRNEGERRPAPAAQALASESSGKKPKNSLFRVDRAAQEAGVRVSSPRSAREKREAEGTQKNEFVVVDAGAAGGLWDMAVGQGQGEEGAGRGGVARIAEQECRETDEAGNSVDVRRERRVRGRNRKPSITRFLEGQSPTPSVERVGVLQAGRRRRVKRWSSVQESYNNLPQDVYSRVFPGSYPYVYSSYNAQGTEGGTEDSSALLPRGSDIRFERKSRASGVHAGRTSTRVKGASKHARGERGYTKTPQQRHARSRNRAKRKVPAREVWALAGETTLLPCDLSVRNPKDSVQMVMWLREGTHTPLFSVDYREQASGKPQVWRDNTASTAQRAYLRLAGMDVGVAEGSDYGHGVRPRLGYGQQATTFAQGYGGERVEEGRQEEAVGLMVRDVERNDSAVYRCRVDFLLTPTRNTRVNLTVVVAPVRVSVEWWMGESGDKERDGVVGLFHEGDAPTLICETRNAWPPPRVVWFEEDVMADDSYASDLVEDAVENTLTLPPLTRDHHNRRFTCIAANSNLTKPIASTVHLRLALDVLVIEMENVRVLSAGTPAEVKCTVWGSNPEPHITWTLNDIILPSAKPWVSNDGNSSVSMVSFTPEPVHDGATLECSAYNEMLMRAQHRHPPKDHRSNSHLVVNYAPRLSVSLGRTLEADNIKEGDDLYFECSAIAKPPPHKVTWSHNGKQLESTAGILVSNMTLVLQKVARSNAGTYTCHATNSEGSAASPPLNLDVKYAPVCATNKASQHSVAKHENARISCNVLANPPVVHFSWAFNNTAEAVNVPEDRYVVQGTESVVNYTPVTELDYGTLLCWATNDIGQQVHPCVFQIVESGKPDPPHNCRAYDVTISSLQVSCLPGDDGGLGQKFVLQVVEANGDFKPVVEVTREAPSFSVANLRPATAYRLLVTATNAKGESRPAELSAYTVALNHPQHETPAEPTRGRESGAEVAVGVLVGAVLACLPVAIAVVVMGVRTCMRLRAARHGRAEENEKESTEGEGGGGTGRPLLPGQGTPGSGGGLSGEGGTDITTITGGVALTTTLPPTPSSVHSEAQVTQVAPTDTSSILYPGGRIYSPKSCQQVAAPPVMVPAATNLRRAAYPTHEDKFDGENELLEITLPPPAAYDQGYQSSYQGCQPLEQCYQPQEQVPARMKAGYPQVFQEYQTVLPAAAYPQGVPVKGVHHPNLQYISSVPLSQGYTPAPVPTSQAVTSASFATLPHGKVTTSSSFSVLPPTKEASHEARVGDAKMSTVYNPLTLFPSPSYGQKGGTAPNADRALHTGSLKRGVKPQAQDILRIRDSARSRSASLSSVASNKRESSV